MQAVTFDFGQTLADIDTEFLAARLRGRGTEVDPARLEAVQPQAWRAYNAGILLGEGGHPWRRFMSELLRIAGAPPERIQDAVEWLWSEQPLKNLWRRPVRGMIELVRRLRVPVGIVSNSEGRLAELVEELGWAKDFAAIADSGVLGIQKPDPRIFRWAAARLRTSPEHIVHVGDSWPADVQGALGAGFCAVWFRGEEGPHGARVRVAQDAAGVERALRELGLTV